VIPQAKREWGDAVGRYEEDYGTKPCSEHNFTSPANFSRNLNITRDFTCMNFDGLELQGTFGSENISLYHLEFHPCSQELLNISGYEGETCASDEDIEDVIVNSILVFVFFAESFHEGVYDTIPIELQP